MTTFQRQLLYIWCIVRFKTWENVFSHLELCYTLHERLFSKKSDVYHYIGFVP